MTHAFETKHLNRFDDGVWAKMFAGMGRRTQTFRSSDVERFFEIASREHPLVTSKAEAKKYVVSTTGCYFRRPYGGCRPKMTICSGDHSAIDAVGLQCSTTGGGQGG